MGKATSGSAGEDPSSDADLVAAVAAADRGALRELFDRHEPWLAARLERRCSDPAAVDSAIQDTFMTLWTSPGSWRGDGEFAAWLWGVAIRSLLQHLRPRRNVLEKLRLHRLDDVQSAEELVLMRIEHTDVGVAFDRLSPELRAVVQAVVLDGLSTREASRILGVPSGTVKSRMSRARTELRKALT